MRRLQHIGHLPQVELAHAFGALLRVVQVGAGGRVEGDFAVEQPGVLLLGQRQATQGAGLDDGVILIQTLAEQQVVFSHCIALQRAAALPHIDKPCAQQARSHRVALGLCTGLARRMAGGFFAEGVAHRHDK